MQDLHTVNNIVIPLHLVVPSPHTLPAPILTESKLFTVSDFCCCRLLFSRCRARLFATPWTAARQACLFLIISQSLLKLMFIELMMPSNHLILCHFLLLSSIFPSTRLFSNELALCIRCPKYWSFSFSISSSDEYLELIHRFDLLAVQGNSLESSPAS